MAGIGSESGWLAPQPARDGERVLARWPANRSQGRRAVGGALFLTDLRLVFCPNRLESWLGGHAWTCELPELSGVGVYPRTGTVFDGGMVDRLQICLHGGAVELFVVKHPPAVAHQLHRLVPHDPVAPTPPPAAGHGGGRVRRPRVALRVRRPGPGVGPARGTTDPPAR